MASRRMFSLDVVDTDLFLEMPATSQNLYFHLGMRADDEGFVSSPKKIAKMVNCGNDDLNILVARGFLIPFEDGVVVIRHWRQNNYIQSDRRKKTLYQADKALLEEKDGVYNLDTNCIQTVSNMDTNCIQTVSNMDTNCIQTVSKLDTQDSIGKYSIKKEESIEKKRESCIQLFERLKTSYQLSDDLLNKTHSWIQYKIERKEPYKEQGMKSLLSQIQKHAKEYGETAVINLIDECMAAGWKGIIWDRLKKEPNKFQNFTQPETDYDSLMIEQVKKRL